MFDMQKITEILGEERETGRTGIFLLSHRILSKLRKTEKLLETEPDFSRSGRDGENLYAWLEENFERLEDLLKNSLRSLRYMGKLKGKGRLPFYFCVFYNLCENMEKADECTLDEIFSVCGKNMKDPDFATGKSLPFLFACAVGVRICESFLGAGQNPEQLRRLVCKTENLFYTLDSVSAFDEERALKNNPVEKVLMQDSMYSSLTDDTKASYRKNLGIMAERERKSEFSLASELLGKCKGTGHVGEYLCDKPCGGKIYLSLLFFLTVIFTVLLCRISPVFIVSIFSVYGCTRLLLDKIYSRYFRKSFTLPRVKIRAIPEKHGVMTVITSLITGNGADDELFAKLEDMYCSNGGENVYFGLLADLCDSETEQNPKDREIVENAVFKILELRKKYGDVFFLFLRDREYSYGEEAFIAPERKRGAVNTLTEFLCLKHDGFNSDSIKPGEKICKNIRYVFTLDADTNLAFGCLEKMVGIMLHPQNKPCLGASCVESGYGILQPAVTPAIEASARNFFTRVMCAFAGLDGYGKADTDNAMRLFGQSVFCGKGMFDKNAFYKVLCGDNEFLHGRVLSHDAPEGARLRCAFVPDVVLTDSFPSEELSYYKRLHRWIRGDVQNVSFLLPKVRTNCGRIIKNEINYAGKFFILNNVLSALVPVFAFVSYVVACVVGGEVGAVLVAVTLSLYLIPFVNVFVLSLKGRPWKNLTRRYYTGGFCSGIYSELLRVIFSLFGVVKTASVSFDAIARSTFRSLFSKKKLLEWTTSAQSDGEKNDGLLGYIKKNLLSAVAGAVTFLFSDNGMLKTLSLLWFFMPVAAYHISKKKAYVPKKADKSDREMINKYCRDMWKYFSENVTEGTNFLPPDNISFADGKRTSRMTSPTNIGFYLLSVVCAEKLGFIGIKETEKRLCDCLFSVEKLETADGLLYNWYDVFTARPMPDRFVSSVDIGNFAACLIAVKGALADMKDKLCCYEKIVEIANQILDKNDLSKLYDIERNLFYIGGKYENGRINFGRNRYDMLMSEARLLSFIAISQRRVPAEHYRCLARTVVEGREYAGLVSWSGTAFEYFLPEIFLASPPSTLCFEAVNFAFSDMVKNGVKCAGTYVFGMSESCYNELDGAGNYKYKAFGTEQLALCKTKQENVISPYSTFLFLPFFENTSCANLENLRRLGAYGEYGFFESMDFERAPKGENAGVVRCFMAHHIGMSIASATNLLYDFAMSEWFCKDGGVKSALPIARERIPPEIFSKGRTRRKYSSEKTGSKNRRPEGSTIFARLFAKNITVLIKRGRFEIMKNGLAAARRNVFDCGLDGFLMCIDDDAEKFCFDKCARVISGSGRAGYMQTFCETSGNEFEANVRVTVDDSTADVVRIGMKMQKIFDTKNEPPVFSVSFYPLLGEKSMSRNCDFFDDSDVYGKVVDGREFYFCRSSSCGHLYCGTVSGQNPSAVYEHGKVTLSATGILSDGMYSAEFAVSLSDIKKCAEMGFVRCRQKNFDTVSEEYEKKKTETKSVARQKNMIQNKILQNKAEDGKCFFPIDSTEKPLRLYALGKTAFLVSQKGAAVTFSHDVNARRLTLFSGVGDKSFTGEKLIFGENFDLCASAVKTEFLPHAVIFKGEYMGAPYIVTCFVCAEMGTKIISVKTCSDACFGFEFLPETWERAGIKIGSGLAFFEIPEKKEEVGFVFGFCRNKDGECIGAVYETDPSPRVSFAENGTLSNREYVLCIGCGTQDEGYEVLKKVLSERTEALAEKTEILHAKLKIRYEKIPSRIKQTLGRYFVFPDDGIVRRIFVKTKPELFLFDAVLLLYTKWDEWDGILNKILGTHPESAVCKYLYCLFVSEFFLSSDGENICPEDVYRRCLCCLFENNTDGELRELFLLCISRFSLLCDRMGDVRTKEALARMREGNSKGIFL